MSEIAHWIEGEKVTEVRESEHGWQVALNGSGFILKKEHEREPLVGDEVELKLAYGCEICGVRINGETVFDKSDDEIKEDKKEQGRQIQIDQISRFQKNKTQLDEAFATLPPEFQRWIARLRSKTSDYRWQYEEYDMTVALDAVKIANRFKGDIEGVKKFHELDWTQQKEMIPDLFDGHSGNSFTHAIQYAVIYMKTPKWIPFAHGALTPLVGCEGYGCHPLTPEEEQEVNALKVEYAGID